MKHGAWSVVVAALLVAGGCGGSVNGTPGDGGGGVDAGGGGKDAPSGVDSPVGSDATSAFDVRDTDLSAGLLYDGTTGKTCASDTDCKGSIGGPGISRCSSTVFAPESYFATPVCIVPTCSPVSGATPHYCDGPDSPSSPGICMPYGTGGGGICLPQCTFDKNGGAAVGCKGKDVCFVDTAAAQGGIGYCWGGCTQDADCPTGQKCQVDQGLCMQGVVPPTKPFGTACNPADTNNGACNCLYGANNTGYCSSFCVVGGPSTCPAGSTCDGLEYRQFGFSTPNAGLGGYCAVACTAGSEAGAGCPASTTCTNIFAGGPDCIP